MPKPTEEEFEAGLLAALDKGLEAKPSVAAAPAAEDDDQPAGLEGPDAGAVEDEIDPEVPPLELVAEDSEGDAGAGVVEAEATPPIAGIDDAPASPTPAVEAAPEPPADPKPSDQFGELDGKPSEKTRERFGKLKSSFDELHTKHEALEKQSKEWEETITSTGTTPQQFGMALEYLSAVNSQSPEGLEKAYEFLNREMETIGRLLGKPVNGYDPLEEHADLKQKVADGYLDKDDALEIAQAREVKALPKKLSDARAAQPAPSMTAQEGVASLAALGAELKAADPSYTAKYASLKPIVEAVVATTPPDLWQKTIRAAYQKITLPAVAAVPTPPKPKAPTPIRQTQSGSGSGTGMKREVGSAMEAVNQALGM